MTLQDWNGTVDEALALQEQWRNRVQRTNSLNLDEIRIVAGLDASYRNIDGKEIGRAAAVSFAFPAMTRIDQAVAIRETTFPYTPGLLSFREMPVVLAALSQLTVQPDVILLDGHGIAHPRRFGLASHLGVYLDTPTIGCAKTLFVGTYQEPGPNAGDWSELRDGAEVIGAMVRTRPGVKPMIISIGHKFDLPTAIELVLRCVQGFRLPEPTRAADILADPGAPLP